LKGNKNEKITERKGFFTDPNDTLNTIYTTTAEIKKAIRKSKRKSAAGPDGLRMSVYSEACENLLEPLQVLFNTINSTGLIPENFKRARVKNQNKTWRTIGRSPCQTTSPKFGNE
jgi:hypothetical protein